MDAKEKSVFQQLKDVLDQNGGLKSLFKEVPSAIGEMAQAAASHGGNALFKTARSLGEFIDWWRRKNGESLTSMPVAIKMFSVIAAYGLYRRFDPLPNRKADKVVMLGITSYLLGLLFFTKNESADAVEDFAAKVALGVESLAPEAREDVMNWANSLTPQQKQKLSEIVVETSLTAEDFVGFIQNETVRDLLGKLAPEGTPRDMAGVLAAIKEFLEETGDLLQSNLRSADERVAKAISNIRGFVNKF